MHLIQKGRRSMARPYRHYHKRPKNSTTESTTFILSILLAGVVWTHKATVLVIGHGVATALPLIIGLLLVMLIRKLLRALVAKQRMRSLDMDGVDSMSGLEFERYIARLLKLQGYTHIKLTERYDLGVDIIATKDGIQWGIQVKRYNSLVKAAAVRQVVTALRTYHCDRAMVVTNSVFSRPARELAKSNNCILIDGSALSRWHAG